MFELAAVGIAQVDAAGPLRANQSEILRDAGIHARRVAGEDLPGCNASDRPRRGRRVPLPTRQHRFRCTGEEELESATSVRQSHGFPNFAQDAVLQAAPPIEKRYLRKDGSPLWAVVRTTLIRDASGQPTTAIRVALDLTARRELETQLAEISEEERQRLGREMHDTLGQQITAIGLKATKLHEQLAAESSPHDSQAEGLLDMIDEAQRQVRSLLKGMLPVEFDAGGLMSALADLADRTHSLHEIDCRFECDGSVPIRDNTAAMHLYRIAQEAVHNAVKHSGARHIVVRLHDGTDITLEIRDDGIGFANKVSGRHSQPTDATQPGGAGLRIMRYRAHLIGGQLTIRSAKPNGTIVAMQIAH